MSSANRAAKKNPHAVALGRKGGQTRTAAKAHAARMNGKRGGRPKKSAHAAPPATARTCMMPMPTMFADAVCLQRAKTLRHLGPRGELRDYVAAGGIRTGSEEEASWHPMCGACRDRLCASTDAATA